MGAGLGVGEVGGDGGGVGEAGIDVGGAVVGFEPGLFGFHEEVSVFFAELFDVFLAEFGVAIGSWGEVAAVPAGGIPVGAGVRGDVLGVAFFAAQEEGDAVMGAGDDEGGAGGGDAFCAAGAEAVSQGDGGDVGELGFDGGDGGLEGGAEEVWGVVEALLEDVDVLDVGA